MKRRLLLFLTLAVVGSPALSGLTLDEALARALEKNPRIQQARTAVEQAAGQRLVFRSIALTHRVYQRAPGRAGRQAGRTSAERAFCVCTRFLSSATLLSGNSGLLAARRNRSAGRRTGVECHSRRSTASGSHSLLHRALRSLARGAGTIAAPAVGRKPHERRGALRSGHGRPRSARRGNFAGTGTRSANRGCASGLRRRDPPTGDGDGRRSRSRQLSCLRRAEPWISSP